MVCQLLLLYLHHDLQNNAAKILKYVGITHKKVVKKMKKSKFREIYDELPERTQVAPKTEWIKRIANICYVHPTTVRCWLAGTQKPDALRQQLISNELNVPVERLF